MSEHLPDNVQLVTGDNGTVSFAGDVVATIAGLATTEVDGVAAMASATSGLADIFGIKQNARNFTKGVRLEIEGDQVDVNLNIIIDYGFPVPEVAQNVQENVKKAIETMTGLTARQIDIYVQGISFEKENRAAAELAEQQQYLLRRQDDEDMTYENDTLSEEDTAFAAAQPVADEPAQAYAEGPAQDEAAGAQPGSEPAAADPGDADETQEDAGQ